MKNFIFISPNFPMTYWKFCRELKNNGLRVLGIGDSPYDDLLQELRDSLDEYYKVSSLENYDEVFKAVAFFTYKYGKIDWLESNNEYWLMRDAALRTEFNITTGPKLDEMDKIKFKSCMKKYYAKAGIPTARYHLVEGLEDALEFAHTVGYPVVVKPDNGVGASDTHKLSNDEELKTFLACKAEKHPDVVAKFAKVTLDSFADYAAHKDSWTADSVPVQKIAKLTGANAADVPELLAGSAFPDAKAQQTTALLDGGTAKAIGETAKFLKEQGKVETVLPDYSPYVSAKLIAE